MALPLPSGAPDFFSCWSSDLSIIGLCFGLYSSILAFCRHWKKIDDLPLTSNKDDNHNLSGINDAVLHFAILVAEERVPFYYSQSAAHEGVKGRREIIRKVLLDVQARTRPTGRVLAYLAFTYLPDYIKRFHKDSDLRWAAVTPSLQDEHTVDEIMKEVGE